MKKIVAFVLILSSIVTVAQTYPSSSFIDVELIDASRDNRSIPIQVHYPENENGEIADETLPVLVFGHGFVMGIDAYQNFVDELVKEGYHLVLVDTEGTFAPNHEEFGKDLAFTLDALIELGVDETSIFNGKIADGGAVMGHSMGGGASFLATQYSDNIKTLLGFAPAETSPSAINAAVSMDIPALIFAGTDDCITPISEHQQLMFDALNGDNKKMIVTIDEGTHCAFANSNVACELGEQLTGCSQILSDQHQYFFPFVKTWLGATLKNNCVEWETFWANYVDNTALSSGIASIQESGDLSFEISEFEIRQDENELNLFEIIGDFEAEEISWLVNGELVQTGGITFEVEQSVQVQAVINYGVNNCSVSSNVIAYQAVFTNTINQKMEVKYSAQKNQIGISGVRRNVKFQLFSENGLPIAFNIEKQGNESVLNYVSHYKGLIVLTAINNDEVFCEKFIDWID